MSCLEQAAEDPAADAAAQRFQADRGQAPEKLGAAAGQGGPQGGSDGEDLGVGEDSGPLPQAAGEMPEPAAQEASQEAEPEGGQPDEHVH